eukprot:CAMPEP_0178376694 /NCGR_PEP_ID=MMETSP0689_2-20121128/3533_1 /TAXON_ID=160604 /ORGANISM="Amphidinium massartii, Strain CS-259" /LENGTH=759 /DNA_ID=CAMNT_0019996721 /DNA_START=5 /DNA_END=2280 /DNA_ORIENTATION=-
MAARKVVLVGDAKVGKSALLSRWTSDSFSEDYEPTVSVELTSKAFDLGDERLRFQVWDMGFAELNTIGQLPKYLRGAAGVVLMYSLSAEDDSTISSARYWYEQLCRQQCQCPLVVVAAKVDRCAAPVASPEARRFCESIGAEHLFCSALDGASCSAVFEALARAMQPRADVRTQQPSLLSSESPVQSPARRTPPNNWPDVDMLQAGDESVGLPATLVPAPAPAPAPLVQPIPKLLKLVVLGDPGVGKTNLVPRLCREGLEAFQADYIPTGGPEMRTHAVTVNGNTVKVQIWDVSGNDLQQTESVRSPVLRGADAVLLVYDVTDASTFENITRWCSMIEGQQLQKSVRMLIIGNKTDLPDRQVPRDAATACGARLQCQHLECSAKCDGDLSDILQALLQGEPVAMAGHDPMPKYNLQGCGDRSTNPPGHSLQLPRSPSSGLGGSTGMAASLTLPVSRNPPSLQTDFPTPQSHARAQSPVSNAVRPSEPKTADPLPERRRTSQQSTPAGSMAMPVALSRSPPPASRAAACASMGGSERLQRLLEQRQQLQQLQQQQQQQQLPPGESIYTPSPDLQRARRAGGETSPQQQQQQQQQQPPPSQQQSQGTRLVEGPVRPSEAALQRSNEALQRSQEALQRRAARGMSPIARTASATARSQGLIRLHVDRSGTGAAPDQAPISALGQALARSQARGADTPTSEAPTVGSSHTVDARDPAQIHTDLLHSTTRVDPGAYAPHTPSGVASLDSSTRSVATTRIVTDVR